MYVEVHKSDLVKKESREAWVESGQWDNIRHFLPLRGGGYFPWAGLWLPLTKNDAAEETSGALEPQFEESWQLPASSFWNTATICEEAQHPQGRDSTEDPQRSALVVVNTRSQLCEWSHLKTTGPLTTLADTTKAEQSLK